MSATKFCTWAWGLLSTCGVGPGPFGSGLLFSALGLLLSLSLLPYFEHGSVVSPVHLCLPTVCPAGWKPGSDTIKPNVYDSKEYFSKHN